MNNLPNKKKIHIALDPRHIRTYTQWVVREDAWKGDFGGTWLGFCRTSPLHGSLRMGGAPFQLAYS